MEETTFQSEEPTFPDVTSASLPSGDSPVWAHGDCWFGHHVLSQESRERQETSPCPLGWLAPDVPGAEPRGKWGQDFD